MAEPTGLPAVLYVDLHLVHEVTSSQAFAGLAARGLKVRRPDLTLATADHSVPTSDLVPADRGRAGPGPGGAAGAQLRHPRHPAARHAQPPPGHRARHRPRAGAHPAGHDDRLRRLPHLHPRRVRALAFGIGTSEVEHVLATQTLLQRRPRTFEVRVEGRLAAGVTAKDVILALLAKIGVGGGTGHVFEYRGPAIRALSMEQRMTICNMSIEGGARAGMVAPDDTTFEYMAGRPYAPRRTPGNGALAGWRTLPGDDGAAFDRTVTLDAGQLEPMVTYGTNPGMGLPITGRVPDPEHAYDPAARQALAKALTYMDLRPGEPLLGRPVDVVFIGSCTNSRISDLRQAAGRSRGRKVDPDVRVLVVPGSQDVKRQAEAEGLAEVFRGRRGRVARGRLLDVPGHERRPARPPASTRCRPPTATSRAARAPAGAPSWPAPDRGRLAIAGRIADARPLVESAGCRRCPSRCDPSPASWCRCWPTTSTPTRSSRPGSSRAPARTGWARGLPADWRYDGDGTPREGFVQPARDGRPGGAARRGQLRVGVVARACRLGAAGPSASGRCLVPLFADIFRNNALKNGLLPVELPADAHAELAAAAEADPDAEVTVDLSSGDGDPARRLGRRVHGRPVRPPDAAGRHRRARLPAVARGRGRRLRGRQPLPGGHHHPCLGWLRTGSRPPSSSSRPARSRWRGWPPRPARASPTGPCSAPPWPRAPAACTAPHRATTPRPWPSPWPSWAPGSTWEGRGRRSGR